MTPSPEQPSSPAAAYGTARRLQLIETAKARGATWATIGATLGMTGPEAKRHAHRLRRETRRAPRG